MSSWIGVVSKGRSTVGVSWFGTASSQQQRCGELQPNWHTGARGCRADSDCWAKKMMPSPVTSLRSAENRRSQSRAGHVTPTQGCVCRSDDMGSSLFPRSVVGDLVISCYLDVWLFFLARQFRGIFATERRPKHHETAMNARWGISPRSKGSTAAPGPASSRVHFSEPRRLHQPSLPGS